MCTMNNIFVGNRLLEKLHDVPAGTTLEHKQDDKKKEVDKTPTVIHLMTIVVFIVF